MSTEIQEQEEIKMDWPLWKATVSELRKLPGYGYGFQIPTAWFERKLGCRMDSAEFAFAMMEIRPYVESEDGYSLQQRLIQDDGGNNHNVIQIPSAAGHGDVAQSWECKMRKYARRAFHIREKTLNNEAANLTQEDRAKMEKESQIAATRIVLLQRETSIQNYLAKNAPKLIQKPS